MSSSAFYTNPSKDTFTVFLVDGSDSITSEDFAITKDIVSSLVCSCTLDAADGDHQNQPTQYLQIS